MDEEKNVMKDRRSSMGDDDELELTCELKKEINNLIWMYGPGSLTLKKAEELACTILASIQEGCLPGKSY
ncbi:hypothetical protein LCGC14_1037050 [marine sediment metagenome]|uniref:Uncharacterized protein n=1 Tax=marine sediment metagenome TaxID=412755 RepID=A0A0F9MXH5_9ZZZZ|nr:hypothetical protein [Candidatus Aminicenantes bacterium]